MTKCKCRERGTENVGHTYTMGDSILGSIHPPKILKMKYSPSRNIESNQQATETLPAHLSHHYIQQE